MQKNTSTLQSPSEWQVLPGHMPAAQQLIRDLFKRYYFGTFLTFYSHVPERYLKPETPNLLHYNTSLNIGFIELFGTKEGSIIWCLYMDFQNRVHLNTTAAYLRKNPGRIRSFYMHLSSKMETSLKDSDLGATLSLQRQVSWPRGHYVVPVQTCTLSPRLKRNFKKTAPLIKKMTWQKTTGLDLSSLIKLAIRQHFAKGILLPSLSQLVIQLQSSDPELCYWICHCEGHINDGTFWTSIIVATLQNSYGSTAFEFLRVSNRSDWQFSWLSPGAVCQEHIIQQLKSMGIHTYNLGAFSDKSPSLNEHKRQYLSGSVHPYNIVVMPRNQQPLDTHL